MTAVSNVMVGERLCRNRSSRQSRKDWKIRGSAVLSCAGGGGDLPELSVATASTVFMRL